MAPSVLSQWNINQSVTLKHSGKNANEEIINFRAKNANQNFYQNNTASLRDEFHFLPTGSTFLYYYQRELVHSVGTKARCCSGVYGFRKQEFLANVSEKLKN